MYKISTIVKVFYNKIKSVFYRNIRQNLYILVIDDADQRYCDRKDDFTQFYDL